MVRRAPRLSVRTLALVALAAAAWAPSLSAVVTAGPAGAATGSHPILPPHEPPRNFRLASVHDVLASINAARRSEEGLAPFRFDSARFSRLSVPEQIFVVSNLERTTRGLYPAQAMVRRLDGLAASAATRDQDPVDNGQGFSSIWSSAPASLGQPALFADFGWMYDDGPPPQYIFRNVDCARPRDRGCWGHRDNILSDPLASARGCPSALVTGTGYSSHTADGPSLTQIFEVACKNLGSAAVFTWRHAVTLLKIPSSEAGLGL